MWSGLQAAGLTDCFLGSLRPGKFLTRQILLSCLRSEFAQIMGALTLLEKWPAGASKHKVSNTNKFKGEKGQSKCLPQTPAR